MKSPILFIFTVLAIVNLGVFLATPILAQQASGTDSVELTNPLGNTYDPRIIIGNIIEGVLGIIGSVALGLFVWGGIQIMISRGAPAKISAGQDTMLYAAIGLAVIFGSYAITQFIIERVTKMP